MDPAEGAEAVSGLSGQVMLDINSSLFHRMTITNRFKLICADKENQPEKPFSCPTGLEILLKKEILQASNHK